MADQHINEINVHIQKGIEQWARVCLMADADQWAYYLNYEHQDVMNVCLLFQHVCSNIGIKAGRISEKEAVEFGNRLHELIYDMTGIDTRKVHGENQQ